MLHDGRLGISAFCLLTAIASAPATEWVRVSEDGRSFVLEKSGKRFVPRGFNYDHDEEGRLLEDYWGPEWDKVTQDFHEMKRLGANVVRIHLQLGRFMKSPREPDATSLDRLRRLVELADRTNLYLDLTGLGCYHKQDVPAWYDALDERQRWETQAEFWRAVARRCADSPIVFCYDLMNEPVVPGKARSGGQWLGPAFADKHFVQFITLDPAGRPRSDVASKWTGMLTSAIRRQDRRHMITVGLVSWSLDRPGLTSGFPPDRIGRHLDFISVHLYPERGRVDDALATLSGFAVGKPVLIEETFPLKCGMPEFETFIRQSRRLSAGWIGFYWGAPPEAYRGSKQMKDAIILAWLEFFQREATRSAPAGSK
ncbi:MAG: cellulase family glycosylhydrolase [Phycisphaerae bacterium]|nr:cellulase family glycosylhydrolase [Phycisphaerae bacterium]